MKVYFVTRNEFKIAELHDDLVSRNLGDRLAVSMFRHDIQEILHADVQEIVRHKTITAYEALRCPCLVEHGGLYMDALPGLPGGLGKVVWDAVGDRLCGFLNPTDTRAATARSILGYCDGRRIFTYIGETRGRIADKARGNYAFAWDPVFIPDGADETYGEMGPDRKRQTSPGAKAWTQFLQEQVQA
ncbi:MAG TPA: non-canonical purine NTP pyrophosphatase [Vicinamibacterales bacterium]